MQPHSIFDPPFPPGFEPTMADHLQIILVLSIGIGVLFGAIYITEKIIEKKEQDLTAIRPGRTKCCDAEAQLWGSSEAEN
jgi:hypothetical protein